MSKKVSRKEFMKALLAAGASAAGASVLAGCAPAATPVPAAPTQAPAAPTQAPTKAPAPTPTVIVAKPRPKMMRISYTTDINFLDPALMQSAAEWMPSYLIFDPLVRYDQTMLEPKPAIAESWTRSEDGKTWVFKIRKGIKYHTGRELKAEDVKFSWRRAIDVGPKGRAAGFLIDVAEFDATGEYEFTVKLKQFSWNFFPNCATMATVMVDKDNEATVGTKPIGTGPYKFVEWKQGEYALYEKNGDYWDKALIAKLPDQIKTVVIPEMQTAIANLKTGDVDVVASVPPQFRKDILSAGFQLIRQQPFSAAYDAFCFGLNEPPFKDNPKLRKAIARAIDRETINKNAYFGEGDVDCNLIPKTHWAYTDIGCDQISFNLDEAKKLLDEAGAAGLNFTCIVNSNDQVQIKTAEIIQESLKKIGVTMKVEVMDYSLWVKEIFLAKKGQCTMAGYTREPDPDGLFSSVLRKGQGNNWMGYENPEVEALFDQGKAELDQKKRIPIYEKIMKITMLQDIPIVKRHTRQEVWAANEHVKGMALLPKGYPNLWEWEWV